MISWVCPKGHGGDWGEKAPVRCADCGGELRITGQVRTVSLGIPRNK